MLPARWVAEPWLCRNLGRRVPNRTDRAAGSRTQDGAGSAQRRFLRKPEKPPSRQPAAAQVVREDRAGGDDGIMVTQDVAGSH